MSEAPDDIVMRLRNPMWVHGPATDVNLDAETCLHDMREAAREIERLRQFEEADKRLRASATRERDRGNDPMGPST